MSGVKPIPDEYHGATPYLSVTGAADAIEFYKTAFGARETMRMPAPGGRSAMPRLGSAMQPSCLLMSIPK